jgi:hypothetical protein
VKASDTWTCLSCRFINPAAATRCGHCEQVPGNFNEAPEIPELEYDPEFEPLKRTGRDTYRLPRRRSSE